MAHFYGTVQGHRGEATRTGSKSSGMRATANSWSVGGEVKVHYDSALNVDVVSFYITRGSDTTPTRIASFAIIDGKRKLLDTNFPEVFL